MSYFVIGFALTFTSTPLTVYCIHQLNASPAQVSLSILPIAVVVVVIVEVVVVVVVVVVVRGGGGGGGGSALS